MNEFLFSTNKEYNTDIHWSIEKDKKQLVIKDLLCVFFSLTSTCFLVNEADNKVNDSQELKKWRISTIKETTLESKILSKRKIPRPPRKIVLTITVYIHIYTYIILGGDMYQGDYVEEVYMDIHYYVIMVSLCPKGLP